MPNNIAHCKKCNKIIKKGFDYCDDCQPQNIPPPFDGLGHKKNYYIKNKNIY